MSLSRFDQQAAGGPSPPQSYSWAGALRSEAPPPVTLAEAESLVARVYGIAGHASQLAGERDHNFRMRSEDGPSYMLKVSHPAEDPEIADFQTDALLHIAQTDPGLCIPKIVLTRDGSAVHMMPIADGRTRIVRLFTWLDGVALCEAPYSAAQDMDLGRFLARLGLALQGFSHRSAGDESLIWDIRRASKTAALAANIANPAKRLMVERAYETFERKVAHLLPKLRAQVIHNDMNPDNVLVSPADSDMVCGILDFGDMVRGPLVCDIAIGATYRWSINEHPLAGACRFLKGYDDVRRIDDVEIALVPDLIRTRLAIATTLAEWQAEQFPENRAYSMRFNAEFWSSLDRLSALTPDEEQRFLRQYLERE